VSPIDDPMPGANFRTDSFPALAVDPRPGRRNLYVSWADRLGGVGRVVLARSTDGGRTWSAPAVLSTPGEGYVFETAVAVAPTGRVDLGFQALRLQPGGDPATFGTGNASIDAWYVSSADGSSWSVPVRVSSVSSDPAASAQNNLARQFWGDYDSLASDATTAWF
ncbi:MAG: hypothetical protein C4344_06405, partial [Acidimicrobiia bacterium]